MIILFFGDGADQYLESQLLIPRCRLCSPIANKIRIEPLSALINRQINSYQGGEQLVPINVILKSPVRIRSAPVPWLLEGASQDICSLLLPLPQTHSKAPSFQPACSLCQSRTNRRTRPLAFRNRELFRGGLSREKGLRWPWLAFHLKLNSGLLRAEVKGKRAMENCPG